MGGKTLAMVEQAGSSVAEAHKAFGGSIFTEDGSAVRTEVPPIRAAVQRVREAVEAAIARDEAQDSTFWQEMAQVFEHGVGYFEDKRRFEAEARQLVDSTRENLRHLEEATRWPMEVAEEHIAQLDAAIRCWRDVLTASMNAHRTVEPLDVVEGWSGQAADEYGASAAKQAEAAREFVKLPESYRRLLREVRAMNLGVLGEIHGRLQGVAMAAVGECRVGGDDRFYVDTANANQALIAALKFLRQVYDQAGKQSDALAVQFNEAGQNPIAVNGWTPAVAGGGMAPIGEGSASGSPEDTNPYEEWPAAGMPVAPALVNPVPEAQGHEVQVDDELEDEDGVPR